MLYSNTVNMGLCNSCLKPTATDVITPDAEIRRQQQAQAAEKRVTEGERRGVRDVERVRRQQERAQQLERRQQEADKHGEPVLKWQAN